MTTPTSHSPLKTAAPDSPDHPERVAPVSVIVSAARRELSTKASRPASRSLAGDTSPHTVSFCRPAAVLPAAG
jgi:hypothetical protein